MAFDTVVLAGALAVRWLWSAGVLDVAPLLNRLLAAVVILQLVGLLWQTLVFLRTDLYALLVSVLGCFNLYRVSSLTLRRHPVKRRLIMAYPPVNIVNSTDYTVHGIVRYRSAFCSDDQYSVGGRGGSWTEPGRGVCLLTEVSAVVQTNTGNIDAAPYTSSGTAYSQFAVIQAGTDSYEVTRRVTLSEDAPPPDYVEPTEEQK